MSLVEDFVFAQDSGEFSTIRESGKLMRYVASINPDATRSEFVAAAVLAGYHRNTAACRFLESRKFDITTDPTLCMQKDGKLKIVLAL